METTPPTSLERPQRQVVFAWDMHYSCNFRCPYCFYTLTGWHELAKKSTYKSAEEWKRVWHRLYEKYGSCHIRITAGEPFTYPGFVDVLAALSQEHWVQVTSNLSLRPLLEDFVRRANNRRVELDCTFHPFEAKFEDFLQNVLLLRGRGFIANVCYLAYPPQMARMEEFKRRFKENGIHMNMAVLWGRYAGKEYPHAYTPEEKRWIKEVIGYEIGPETVGLEPIPTKGKICGAGQRYAVIHADGRAVRCGQLGEETIGNILDENFELFQTGRPCPSDYCRCKEFQMAWEEEEKQALLQRGEVKV
ncbi:MAG TPA: radical SAM protein [Elusimicrobiota bacterium]|nr:radical SAM protein [Elusimicrobiota bacterium]